MLYTHWVDYLQLDPSIDLQERAPDGVQADLTVRGSTFEQALVLLNGLRMDDVQTSHHDLDLPLRTGALARIEVLPGAGSTRPMDRMPWLEPSISSPGRRSTPKPRRAPRLAISEPSRRLFRPVLWPAGWTKNWMWRGIFPRASCRTATIAV
ncbi:MAG: TonB-dependent receptor [Terriglobales bacterium]